MLRNKIKEINKPSSNKKYIKQPAIAIESISGGVINMAIKKQKTKINDLFCFNTFKSIKLKYTASTVMSGN
ncbi:hypothetical protein TOL5_33640 [Acinetobacter sp. Tol 5]|nr:hypothetical protein TOL5_33640 [Acinetobacter sp. Tol 5]